MADFCRGDWLSSQQGISEHTVATEIDDTLSISYGSTSLSVS